MSGSGDTAPQNPRQVLSSTTRRESVNLLISKHLISAQSYSTARGVASSHSYPCICSAGVSAVVATEKCPSSLCHPLSECSRLRSIARSNAFYLSCQGCVPDSQVCFRERFWTALLTLLEKWRLEIQPHETLERQNSYRLA